MTSEADACTDSRETPPPVKWWARMLRILLALAFVGAGAAGAAYLKKTAPKTKKRPPVKWVPLVTVQGLEAGRHQIVVNAMGTVVPARQVVLKARVSGQVVAVNPEFTVGGFIQADEEILRLEDTDYQLALVQRRSDLANSEYALALEQGRQEVARREWGLLNGGAAVSTDDASLALRKPHLDKVRADMAAAEAAMQKADLDLARTVVKAPFNAMVRSRTVDLGSQVSAQEPLAELVGTDVYWVRAILPVSRLNVIDIPRAAGDRGSLAEVHYSSSHTLPGRVVRLLGDLASDGRMAQVLIAVTDPLNRKGDRPDGPPLLIGEYVRVAVFGRQLDDVFAVPRAALRDGDTVWLAEASDTLAIRRVEPVWRGPEAVLLRDHLESGDRLILSDLSAPVAGMALRVEASGSPSEGGPPVAETAPAESTGGAQ
jgi:RND family efflux transporter MFP subunit